MKSIIKILMLFASLVFVFVAVIKIVQGCSWKEAVGIAEEYYNEIKEKCPCCNNTESAA